MKEKKDLMEQAVLLYKAIKTPLGIGFLLLVVLGLLVFTPAENLPLVLNLIKALTQVLLLGGYSVPLD